MINLIPPEGVTEEQLEAFLVSLRVDARDRVREMLAAGAPAVEINDYLASLELSPAGTLAPTEEEK